SPAGACGDEADFHGAAGAVDGRYEQRRGSRGDSPAFGCVRGARGGCGGRGDGGAGARAGGAGEVRWRFARRDRRQHHQLRQAHQLPSACGADRRGQSGAMTSQADPRAPRVVLVGPPGAGKSTIGRKLARELGVQLYDTDAGIEEQTGRTIADIFATDGEAEFRKIEEQVVRRAVLDEPGVVSLGGGAVLSENTRALLREHTVVYLEISVAEGLRRTGTSNARPLLNGADPGAKYRELMRRRRPLYREVATVRVRTDGRSPSRVVRMILSRLGIEPAATDPEPGAPAQARTSSTAPGSSRSRSRRRARARAAARRRAAAAAGDTTAPGSPSSAAVASQAAPAESPAAATTRNTAADDTVPNGTAPNGTAADGTAADGTATAGQPPGASGDRNSVTTGGTPTAPAADSAEGSGPTGRRRRARRRGARHRGTGADRSAAATRHTGTGTAEANAESAGGHGAEPAGTATGNGAGGPADRAARRSRRPGRR